MPLRKDQTIWSASFRNLKLKAWGFDQVIRETFVVSVYQESCKPERWAARPSLKHGGHAWSGPSAQNVMQTVAGDFEEQLSEWTREPDRKGARPDLRSGADVASDRRPA